MKDREVTTRTIRLHDPEGHYADKRFAAMYDRSRDNFYVEVPHFLLHRNEDESNWVTGDTPKMVLDHVEDLCRRYTGKTIRKRRVILFSFLYQTKVKSKDDETFRRHEGVMLRLRWHSCWEFTCKKDFSEARQFGATETGPSLVDGDWIEGYGDDNELKVIPWTAEREAFLTALERSMERAGTRMVEFFQSTTTAAKAMDRMGTMSPRLLTGSL